MTSLCEYIENPFFVGAKLSNLQYRNDVDIDNQFRIPEIYSEGSIDECEIDIHLYREDGWYKRRVAYENHSSRRRILMSLCQ